MKPTAFLLSLASLACCAPGNGNGYQKTDSSLQARTDSIEAIGQKVKTSSGMKNGNTAQLFEENPALIADRLCCWWSRSKRHTGQRVSRYSFRLSSRGPSTLCTAGGLQKPRHHQRDGIRPQLSISIGPCARRA